MTTTPRRPISPATPRRPTPPRAREEETAVPPMSQQAKRILGELEAQLVINENDLHNECRMQPDLFYRISKAQGRVQAERDQAYRERKRAEAEVAMDVRADWPTGEGSVRMTDAAVAAAVEMSRRVIDAYDEVSRLDEILSDLTALKDAYADRSHMLRKLSDLWLGNYYGTEIGGSGRVIRENANERDAAQVRRARAERNRT